MTDERPMAWLPHSIAEAALSGGGVDVDLPNAGRTYWSGSRSPGSSSRRIRSTATASTTHRECVT